MRPTRRALAATLLAAPALAQGNTPPWPDRPIRIIVSFPPGGSSDLIARAVGKEMSATLNQTVVADNRAGANGTIAAALTAASAPDGYTLCLVALGHAVNPSLYPSLPYDTARDFTPLSLLATYPQVVLVPPGSPARDIPGLIALARQRTVTYASGGNGSSQHLAGALFARMAGVTLNHVPYRGGAPALLDVVAGTVDMIITQPSLSMLTSGELRPLAVTSAQRQPWAPAVPTLAEAALPGYESVAWYGLVAPRGLAAPVLARLSAAIMAAVRTPAAHEVIASQGGEPAGTTPEAFAAHITREAQRYAGIVAATEMKAD